MVLGRVRKLFRQIQGQIDWLNKVINENILGAALIRLLNTQAANTTGSSTANGRSARNRPEILRLFAAMIPIITFLTNLATLTILALGGHFVISGADDAGRVHRLQCLSRAS